jgi:hypothetical protein
MRPRTLLRACALVAALVLSLDFGRAVDAAKEEAGQLPPPDNAAAVKVGVKAERKQAARAPAPIAAPAKVAAQKTREKKAPRKHDGQITIEDWWDLGVAIIGAANDLFGLRRRGVAVAVAPDAAGVNAQQFDQQYGPRFRQLYKSELHFMRLVCDPTKEQFTRIATAAEVEMKGAMKKCSEKWVEARSGRLRADAAYPDARRLMADGILKAVKSNLPSERAARYQAELDAREAARDHTVIVTLVAAMDAKLLLTPDQRTKIAEVLSKNRKPSWRQTQALLQVGYNFPVMPDNEILPILTEHQKSQWNKVQKGVNYFMFELDSFQGIDVDDEVWVDLGEKPK